VILCAHIDTVFGSSLGPPTTVDLVSGAFDATGLHYVLINGEGNADDTLTDITNGTDGQELVIEQGPNFNAITVQSGGTLYYNDGGADQVLGPGIELLEIVRRVIEVLAPVEAEPAHVGLDGVDILLLLLGRVGVVEAQMAAPAELLGNAEVQADRLGMADVEIAVRLRWKARHHRRMPLGVEIGLDDVANEIAPHLCCNRFCCHWEFLFGDQRTFCQIRTSQGRL
jgi:hypothetical protein